MVTIKELGVFVSEENLVQNLHKNTIFFFFDCRKNVHQKVQIKR